MRTTVCEEGCFDAYENVNAGMRLDDIDLITFRARGIPSYYLPRFTRIALPRLVASVLFSELRLDPAEPSFQLLHPEKITDRPRDAKHARLICRAAFAIVLYARESITQEEATQKTTKILPSLRQDALS